MKNEFAKLAPHPPCVRPIMCVISADGRFVLQWTRLGEDVGTDRKKNTNLEMTEKRNDSLHSVCKA